MLVLTCWENVKWLVNEITVEEKINREKSVHLTELGLLIYIFIEVLLELVSTINYPINYNVVVPLES